MVRIPTAAVQASWPKANLINPETKGNSLIIANALFTIPAVLLVGLRLWSKNRTRSLWWDDALIVASLVCGVPLSILTAWASVKCDWNLHVWDITSLTTFTKGLKVIFASKLLFGFAVMFSRASIILFYYRLLGGTGTKWWKWVLHVCMFCTIGLCFAWLFITVFNCKPIAAYWSFDYLTEQKCLDEGVWTIVCSCLNLGLDIVITLLPIPLVMKLKMPLRQRVGITLLLGLGGTVCVSGALRPYYVYQALIGTYDETWYTIPIWICSAVEVEVAIMCACGPSLKPLVTPLLKSVLGYTGFSSSNGATSGKGRSSRTTKRTQTQLLSGANDGEKQTTIAEQIEAIKSGDLMSGIIVTRNFEVD